MRIATWNVNSLGVRLPQVLAWLATQEEPIDALGLQELKLTEDKFPFAEFEQAGYEAHAFGQKTYNGVAWLLRKGSFAQVSDVSKNIANFEDEQARVIALTVIPAGADESKKIRLVNGYFVNGQAPATEKFEYKMRWLSALRKDLQQQLVQHPRLVLLGDFNITRDDRDSYDAEGLRETIHHTTEEREHLQYLFDLGLHDAFRLFNQEPKQYSWWDYRDLGFRRNKGLRIDFCLVSDALKEQTTGCVIDKTPRKNERPSDHTPVILSLSFPRESV